MHSSKSKWSLPKLLGRLHDDIQHRLTVARDSLAHPTAKGDASENIWLRLLQDYLPKRYQAETAHVVDCHGNFSEQIDVVVFDRQYSPFIFTYENQFVIPAESVYAVLEAKQTINAQMVTYAQNKVASVRNLHRTNLEVPHAGGVIKEPRPPFSILGGILALDSDWKPPLGAPLQQALNDADEMSRLDLGCIAAHGVFVQEDDAGNSYRISSHTKPATSFLFTLISKLRNKATVPVLDIDAYAAWLEQSDGR